MSALIVVSSLSLPLMAADGKVSTSLPTLVMRTGEHPAFDRVVFDASKGVRYTLAQSGNTITLAFASAAKVTLSRAQLSRAHGFHIASGADGTSPLVVRFSVAPNAKIKDFMSGTSIVIDVSGEAVPASMKNAPQNVQATAAQTVLTKEKAKPALDAPTNKSDESEEKNAKQDQKPAPQISPTPLPPKPDASAAHVTPAAPAAVLSKEITVLPQDVGAPVTPQPMLNAGAELAPSPQAAPRTSIDKAETNLPSEPAAFVSPVIKTDPRLLAQVQDILKETNPQPVAVFDPKIPVGAAIFVRGGYITVLFDRKLAGDSLMMSPAPRLKLEPLVLPRNTGFRIAVPEGVGVRSTRKGTAWEIYLIPAGTPPALSTDFVAQPEFALGARLLVSTPAPPQPVFYSDPVVGDDLIILPLTEAGAFSIRRRLSDFYVIAAAQGLVIKPRHERVVARVVPDGVELTAEGGLKLSPPSDASFSHSSRDASGKLSKKLYDFEHWRGRDGETFSQTRQSLMQTIIDVKEEERVLARLDLARFYFAHGEGLEALAILSVVEKKLPEIVEHPDFLAVRGGANALVGHIQEAVADLNHPSLADQQEAILWKAVAAAGVRDWVSAFDQFSTTWDILLGYPEPFRSKFAMLALESAVAAGKDDKIGPWLSQIEKRGYISVVEPAFLYLKGVTFSKAGRADMAEKLWRQVVRGNDRLYKIRAELALVDLGVATKSLTPKQAVDRLEGLRFAWRGDDLELDVLTRLGWFYMDSKNFRMGFNVLTQALRLFPNAQAIPALRAEMTRTFHDIFMTDLGKSVSPIDALSLFTDYKTLLPAGEEGNAVRKNLAERLIDIDLLDPAAKLLKDVIKNASKPDERVNVATRLAAVSLLDRKVTDALQYLDQSQEEAKTMPQAVLDERQLLRVRALSELGKYDEAQRALPAQASKASMLLRADIAMRAKNWPDATTALMALIGPPKADKPLQEDQANWLVTAALCLSQSGDVSGLDRLAIDYGAAMDATGRSNLFRILTQPDKVSQFKDLRSAQTKLGEVDMFRGVLDSYRTTKKP